MVYWWEELDETEYRPKYPDSPFLHIADLVNPETGKTYREENREKAHYIPIGALVEVIESGVRLFVVYHGRDCDQTPLYYLAADQDDTKQWNPGFMNNKWIGGYEEESLKIIKHPVVGGIVDADGEVVE